MSQFPEVEVGLDQADCCGSGMCANLAPRAFEIDPSGVAKVLPTAPSSDRSQLLRAAKSCPTACITLLERGEEIDLFQ
ncbi:ferredoxin [Rhodococcus sp. NPDC127530]|uniref:ferredoxin n=1 Tax=unclassified Rhodococcus (in: high G+C Gram-positive bacteria) TaxID=192944 RepID=UPI00364299E2